jgi:hypothetical protein
VSLFKGRVLILCMYVYARNYIHATCAHAQFHLHLPTHTRTCTHTHTHTQHAHTHTHTLKVSLLCCCAWPGAPAANGRGDWEIVREQAVATLGQVGPRGRYRERSQKACAFFYACHRHRLSRWRARRVSNSIANPCSSGRATDLAADNRKLPSVHPPRMHAGAPRTASQQGRPD